MRPATERSTTITPCPGDCVSPLALHQGSSSSFCRPVRLSDCSARTCRIPACTEPKERLNTSANGSVASWQCFGPEQVSRSGRHDDGILTETGNRVTVPAPEAPAAVALFGLERGNCDGGGGPQELGSLTIQKRLVSDSDGHPSGGLQSTGDRGPISCPGQLLRAHAEPRSPGRAGSWQTAMVTFCLNGGGPWRETIPGRHGGLEP